MGYDHAVYDHLTHTAADSDDINNYYYGMFEQPAEAYDDSSHGDSWMYGGDSEALHDLVVDPSMHYYY